MVPVGAQIIDENGDPVYGPRGYTGSQSNSLNGRPFVVLNTSTGVLLNSITSATIHDFYQIDSIHFSDGTVQTRAARTDQDLYTTSTVTFATVTANKFIAAEGATGTPPIGYTFYGDPTTGMYSPSQDIVEFAVWGNKILGLAGFYELSGWTPIITAYSPLIPALDTTYDIGAAGLRWANLYAKKLVIGDSLTSATILTVNTLTNHFTVSQLNAVELTAGSSNWTFNSDGLLTLPNGAKIGSGDSYKFATDNTVVANIDLRNTSGAGFYTDGNGFTLRSNGSYNWIFRTNGGLTFPDGTTQTTAFVVATLTNVTYVDITSTGALTVNQTKETYTSLTGATGVVTHNCNLGQIFYHTNVANTFTVNLTNLSLSNNRATNITLVINQGAVAYIASALQINGNPQNILWQGSLTPPSGNLLKTDVMSFSIMSTGTNAYIVFGQLVSYG
jgi:hypothetical protein